MTLRERVRRWPFWAMLAKEFIQMRRDRFTLGMMIGIPAIQLAMFGYAIQTEVRHLPTVVLDQSQSPESRRFIQAMVNTGNFDLAGAVRDRVEMAERIGRGEAKAGIVLPPDFERDIKRGRTATAQIVVDAADPLASSAAISGAGLAGAVRSQALAAAHGVTTAIEVRVRPWYNPALRSAVYIVPGIIGVLLSVTMIVIASISIVRERERGTLEQLVVTPIGKTSLMLGKIVPFLLVGYVQITVILILGRILFDVPIRGSLTTLYLVALPFVVASLAIGLFVSTLVKTQAQAMQLGFLFLLPNILLSGFMFPREAMPAPAQWLGAALPLTYFLTMMRGILLRGVGLGILWHEAVILVGFSVVLIGLSVRRFRKSVE
ncbi:MAG TPA: ABC transporter permease [Gemmatimonadales bacterium]|nr:ABC transporter permease [Gemmatimonadales bacterium]